MVFSKSLAVASAVSAVSPFAHAFNAQAKSNIAVYWGQGDNQARLSHFCQDTSLDIINIGFVNIFPDQGAANWPGSNFGNQCNGLTYEIGGVKTELLSGCHQIMEDIPICQAAGKKVLLSLGGATPDNQKILSTKSAIGFAEFLWASFGPVDDAWVAWGGPRPFGNVSVDGFDFDIEHNGGFGYASMVTRFRELFAEKPDQKFYLSGSPQCHLPDKQLGLAIATSAFDFVWVQFYNNDDCSARNFVGGEGFNFDAWVDIIKSGGNPDAKLFVGLPGSKAAALDGYYLPPDEVKPLASKYMKLYPDTFGGIMVWEATQSDRNQINGTSYAGNMKRILTELDPTPPAPTTPPSSSPNVSSTPIRSSTPVSSLTPSPSTTPAQSSTPVASSTSLVSSTPVRSSTPIVSSAPAHSGTASSTPLMSSSPVHSTTPVHFSTPLIPSTSTRSSSPAHSGTASSTPLVSSSRVRSSTPAQSSAPAHSSTPIVSSAPAHSGTASSTPLVFSSPIHSSTPVHSSTSLIPSTSTQSNTPVQSSTPLHSSTPVQSRPPSSSSISDQSSTPIRSATTSTALVPDQSSTPATSLTQSGPGTIVHSSSPISSMASSVSGTPMSSGWAIPSATPIHSGTPISSGELSSSSAPTATSSSVTPTEPGPSSSAAVSENHSSTEPDVSTTPYSTDVSVSPTASGPTGTSTSGSSSTITNSGQISQSSPIQQHTSYSATASSSVQTANPATSAGAEPDNGSGTVPITSGIATPSVTPTSTTSEPITVTTVIVTSYIDICPTGFTTITTTYTTTYCPGTVSATATATNLPSGPLSQTALPTPPEGWTSTVTVCTHCAPTPTTVTLTLPVTTTLAEPVTVPESQTTAAPPVEGWTTTVTVCTECTSTPTTLTFTVPATGAGSNSVDPTSTVSIGNTIKPSGHESSTNSVVTNTVISHSQGPPPSSSVIVGTGNVRPSSSTLDIRPSVSGSRVPVAPSETQDNTSPVFTGAAFQTVALGRGASVLVALALPVYLLM